MGDGVMEGIVFKRVLHPVGQGAFFTEQFCNEGEKKPFVNVVYDCGSFTNIEKLVEYEIRNTFEKTDHIDVLFVSHFDEDHTNELMTLMSQAKIGKDTKVVIPFKYPYLLMVMDEDYPSLSKFIMQAFNDGCQLIGVDEGMDLNRPGDPMDLDRLSNGDTMGGRQVIRINNGNKTIWYYYPFMLPELDSLQAVFAKKIEGVVDPKNACDILKKRKELRAIYKTIGKKKGDVTKINVNSLLVVSFPAKNIACDTTIWHFVNPYWIVAPTCFYTGDSNLKGKGYDTVTNLVEVTLKQYSDEIKIGIMQVPHHGSSKCYPEKMADSGDKFVVYGFVNCNPMHRQKVFDSNIIGKFTRNRKTLFLVTETYHSRIEAIAELRQKKER